MHRLVAEFARGSVGGDDARSAVEVALLAEANRLNNTGIPGTLLAWQARLPSATLPISQTRATPETWNPVEVKPDFGISAKLGISRNAVHKHVKSLRRRGYRVNKRRRGKIL